MPVILKKFTQKINPLYDIFALTNYHTGWPSTCMFQNYQLH